MKHGRRALLMVRSAKGASRTMRPPSFETAAFRGLLRMRMSRV
jgi:hypothetical protein